MTYWQIASGNGNVDLEDVFIKLNVALIGPGFHGDFFDHRDKYLSIKREGPIIQKFCEEVAIGDIFILKRLVNPRKSEWDVKAVGTVIGPYRYEPIFENVDIEHWEMQHCRRVQWSPLPNAERVTGGGARIRFQRCEDENILVNVARKTLGRQRA